MTMTLILLMTDIEEDDDELADKDVAVDNV